MATNLLFKISHLIALPASNAIDEDWKVAPLNCCAWGMCRWLVFSMESLLLLLMLLIALDWFSAGAKFKAANGFCANFRLSLSQSIWTMVLWARGFAATKHFSVKSLDSFSLRLSGAWGFCLLASIEEEEEASSWTEEEESKSSQANGESVVILERSWSYYFDKVIMNGSFRVALVSLQKVSSLEREFEKRENRLCEIIWRIIKHLTSSLLRHGADFE